MSESLNWRKDEAPLLVVESLAKTFEVRDARLRARSTRAVDGVSFTVARGETFGIVGESGSGKSTIGRLLLRLHEASGGSARLGDVDLLALAGADLRAARSRIQMVFQDPLGSFDPRASVRTSLRPFARLGGRTTVAQQDAAIDEAATSVGLDPRIVDRVPARISGGQLQRLSVARALLAEPELIFLDEPTSALDVSIRGQIVNLLLDVQADRRVSYLLVAHDLRVIYAMADRVAVMYLGQFVEVAPREELFRQPRHPYTRGLLGAAALDVGAAQRETIRLRGELSDADADRPGCRLAPRCPFVEARCDEPQPLVQIGPQHAVRCWKAPAIPTSALPVVTGPEVGRG